MTGPAQTYVAVCDVAHGAIDLTTPPPTRQAKLLKAKSLKGSP